MDSIMNTIEEKIKALEQIKLEFAEYIVIDFANLSGREVKNRARFREKTIKNLSIALNEAHEAGRKGAIQKYLKSEEGKIYQDYETLKKMARKEALIDAIQIVETYTTHIEGSLEVLTRLQELMNKN